ncbi:MAG: DNA mismatch repair endonuclease MutL [Planctomycetes bacterium]|nr:DNA mismatch repair endonuclease MutL [Planctomycetota bacterium]
MPPELHRARIRVLSERVKNQIAAGEVVERPASVVKELVENALDAGATRIEVDLEEGGVRLVRVVDDGGGMDRADVALAFVAHATSKLHDVEDLDHIASLGFRGEALASIGAVARCSILARRVDEATGWRVTCEGGALSEVVEAGAPAGTRIEVRDLFYNVPARRRFLRQTATELGRCLDVLQRLALAHEGVAFRVTHAGKRALDVEAGLDLRARVRRLFGADLADALVDVRAVDGSTRLAGLVAPPRFARGDLTRQMWFINGRTVRDKVLLRALKDGYHGFVFDHRQPVAFLALAMDPAAVDVNVHPQKSDVRFRDERRLFGFLVNAIREGVRRTDMATPAARLLEIAGQREARASVLPFRGALAGAPRAPAEPFVVRPVAPGAPGAPVSRGAVGRGASDPGASSAALGGASAAADARLDATAGPAFAGQDAVEAGVPALAGTPLLQIARTYIVRALPDGFEIVDQHALHERITFEALRAELARDTVEVQRLLVPELVEVDRAQVELISARVDELARAGVLVEPFGETTLAVHGLPARLQRPRPALLVRDVVALLEEDRALSGERLLEEVLQRAACRASVMAGDALSEAEMRALLERGRPLESDQTCVHGRPTRVRFALADLERAFHRR